MLCGQSILELTHWNLVQLAKASFVLDRLRKRNTQCHQLVLQDEKTSHAKNIVENAFALEMSRSRDGKESFSCFLLPNLPGLDPPAEDPRSHDDNDNDGGVGGGEDGGYDGDEDGDGDDGPASPGGSQLATPPSTGENQDASPAPSTGSNPPFFSGQGPRAPPRSSSEESRSAAVLQGEESSSGDSSSSSNIAMGEAQ